MKIENEELKKDLEALFRRREELRQRMNKDSAEYSALGRMISTAMKVAEEEKEQKTLVRLQEQIEQQTRNGRNDVYVDNKDLELVSGMAMNEGKTFVNAEKLQEMIDEYER